MKRKERKKEGYSEKLFPYQLKTAKYQFFGKGLTCKENFFHSAFLGAILFQVNGQLDPTWLLLQG